MVEQGGAGGAFGRGEVLTPRALAGCGVGPHRPRQRLVLLRRLLLLQWPGDVGGLERLVDRDVDLEVAQAGDGGELGRVGVAEHGPRLVLGQRAQADAVGEVGLQSAQLALLETL